MHMHSKTLILYNKANENGTALDQPVFRWHKDPTYN